MKPIFELPELPPAESCTTGFTGSKDPELIARVEAEWGLPAGSILYVQEFPENKQGLMRAVALTTIGYEYVAQNGFALAV